MICSSCQQNLPETARFCPYCGAAVPEDAPAGDAQGAAGGKEDGGPHLPACSACGDGPGPLAQAEREQAAQQHSGESAAVPKEASPTAPQAGADAALPVSCAGPVRGMRVRDYFLCLVLFCIPVLGLVPMVAWAFSPRVHEEKRRLAQAALCLAAVVLAAILLALVLAVFVLKAGAAPVRNVI